MRIAYVCADPGVPVFGSKGASVHVQEVLRALGCGGEHELVLFAARPGGPAPTGLENLAVHELPRPETTTVAAREMSALGANDALRAVLAAEGPFDLVYERYSLWSFAGMEYAQDAGVPGLLEVNAPLIEEQAERRVLVHRAEAERVAGRVFSAAAALLAVSQPVADHLDRYPGASGRVHVVPNGVALDRFEPGLIPSCPGPPGSFTVGFAGSLKPWHGLDVLVQAFALLWHRVPEARLLVVGDGPQREPLEADLDALGITGATVLTGAVAPAEVPGLMASMDVAVAPYPELPWFYFSPLKAYEYMACGLPLVASRIGQLDGLIEDGSTGLLCEPGRPLDLARSLERLSRDPRLRARLGRAARARVQDGHGWDVVAARILDLAGLPSTSRRAA